MKGYSSWLDVNGTRPNRSSENCAKVTNSPPKAPTSKKLVTALLKKLLAEAELEKAALKEIARGKF